MAGEFGLYRSDSGDHRGDQVGLGKLDEVIAAGQRIGLMIFSSDRDFTLWPAPGTKLTVDLDATSIELPMVGGIVALRRAFDQGGS